MIKIYPCEEMGDRHLKAQRQLWYAGGIKRTSRWLRYRIQDECVMRQAGPGYKLHKKFHGFALHHEDNGRKKMETFKQGNEKVVQDK